MLNLRKYINNIVNLIFPTSKCITMLTLYVKVAHNVTWKLHISNALNVLWANLQIYIYIYIEACVSRNV